MAEPITVVPGTAGLHERTAAVALRVADVIEACAADSPGADQAAGFLRAWADSVPYRRAGGDDAFGRTAAGFGLEQPRVRPPGARRAAGRARGDRRPPCARCTRQSEPRPTVGLAALLIGGADGRRAVRSLLTDGAAARNHLLLVTGRTTYFERSLQLPDGMWETWHGDDGWPADLSRVPMGPPPPGLGGWLTRPEVAAAVDAVRRDAPVTVLIVHEDERVARARAAAVAQAAGRAPLAARLAATDHTRAAQLGAQAVARGATRSWSPSPHPKSRLASWLSRTSPARSSCAPRRGPCGRPATEPCCCCPPAWSRSGTSARRGAGAVPQLAGSAAAIAARHPMDPAVTAALTADAQAHVGSLDLAGVSRLVRARAARVDAGRAPR